MTTHTPAPVLLVGGTGRRRRRFVDVVPDIVATGVRDLAGPAVASC